MGAAELLLLELELTVLELLELNGSLPDTGMLLSA